MCTACDLYKRATQTVFGEGNPKAAIVLVGEQPGHEEDRAGRPFVGPAGRLLDEALVKPASIATGCTSRMQSSISNGSRPRAESGEYTSARAREKSRPARPWFQQELWLIQPDALVLLPWRYCRPCRPRSRRDDCGGARPRP